MKPTVCTMPEPVRRSEAEIYRSIRDKLVRAHCDRKAGAHQCCGAITITRADITLNCRLCGDVRSILPVEEMPQDAHRRHQRRAKARAYAKARDSQKEAQS